MHGDYLDALRSLPDECAGLVLTDPPYGVKYQNQHTSEKHEVLLGDDAEFSYADLAREAHRILHPNTAAFFFTGWSTYPAHFEDVRAAGFKMREPLVCQKRMSGTADLAGSFATNADWAMFAHKGRFTFRETRLLRNERAGTVPNKGGKPVGEWKRRFPSHWFGESYPYATENPATLRAMGVRHPTVKGLELIKWMILMCSDEGDLVVDPFMGSGTTAVACAQTGRRYFGAEKDPTHYATILKRLEMRK